MKKGLTVPSPFTDLVSIRQVPIICAGIRLICGVVIQGTSDVDFSGKLTQEELSNTLEFAMESYNKVTPEEESHGMALMNEMKSKRSVPVLTEDDQRILRTIQARKMLQCEGTINLNHFAKQSVNGLAPRLERGMVGLSLVIQNKEGNVNNKPQAPAIMKGGAIGVIAEDVKVH